MQSFQQEPIKPSMHPWENHVGKLIALFVFITAQNGKMITLMKTLNENKPADFVELGQ